MNRAEANKPMIFAVSFLLLAAAMAVPLPAHSAKAEAPAGQLPFPVKFLLLEQSALATSGTTLAETLDKARDATFNMLGVRAEATTSLAAASREARQRGMQMVVVVSPFSAEAAESRNVPDTWLCQTTTSTVDGVIVLTTAPQCLNLMEPAVRRNALDRIGTMTRSKDIDAVLIDLSSIQIDYGPVSRAGYERAASRQFRQWPADVCRPDGETTAARQTRDDRLGWRAWWLNQAMLFVKEASAAARSGKRLKTGLCMRQCVARCDELALDDRTLSAIAAARDSGKPVWPVADFVVLDAGPTWFPAEQRSVSDLWFEVSRIAARCYGDVPFIPLVCLDGDDAAQGSEEALTTLYQESGGLALQCWTMAYPDDAWLDLTRVLEAPRRQLE